MGLDARTARPEISRAVSRYSAIARRITTQACFAALAKASGFPIVTYESEYNTVNQVVLDPESALYTFSPDFVVVLTAVQALRDSLLATSAAVSGPTRPIGRRGAELVSSVELAETPGVTVVVNEFVLPYERAWGNFTRQVDGSLPRVVARDERPPPCARGGAGQRVHRRHRPHRVLAREARVVRRAALVPQQELLPSRGAPAGRRSGRSTSSARSRARA